MLPKDAITYNLYIPKNSEGIFIISETPPFTILGMQFTQGTIASYTKVKCGEEIIYNNFAKDIAYLEVNKICNNTLKIEKTGSDEAMIIINYIPYVDTSTTTISVSTYGELLTNYFLFIIIVGGIFGFFIKRFLTQKK